MIQKVQKTVDGVFGVSLVEHWQGLGVPLVNQVQVPLCSAI